MDDAQKSRKQLLRELAVYRDLIEQISDIPYSATADGIVTYVGPQVARYGLSPTDVASKSFVDFIAPVDRERIVAAFQRSISTGEEFPTEFRFQTQAGETYWFEGMGACQYDDRGEVTNVRGVVRDVTERRRTLDALKASEEKLATICDSALDAVVLIDDAGKVVHWNPAAERIFGYRSEEILGRDPHEMLTPARYRAAAAQGSERFFRTGTGYAIGRVRELESLKKDGSEFPIEIAVSPIQMGGRWWATAVIRDITERRRAAEDLRREHEQLRRLLANYERDRRLVAYELHDRLTQPLIAALMQMEALLKACRNGVSERIAAPCQEATRLLRASLDEARRMMGGLGPAILDEMGLRAAIEHMIYENQRQGTLEIEYEEDVTFDRLPPHLETVVFRVLQEGLANACRHSKSQKVRIAIREHEEKIHLEIQDWGIGFEPAGVAENHYGLEGIRMRAQLFGGQATIDSSTGKGTRIIAELPWVERHRPAPAGDENGSVPDA